MVGDHWPQALVTPWTNSKRVQKKQTEDLNGKVVRKVRRLKVLHWNFNIKIFTLKAQHWDLYAHTYRPGRLAIDAEMITQLQTFRSLNIVGPLKCCISKLFAAGSAHNDPCDSHKLCDCLHLSTLALCWGLVTLRECHNREEVLPLHRSLSVSSSQ